MEHSVSIKGLLSCVAAVPLLSLLFLSDGILVAQSGMALTGEVTSMEEGKMEGVVVTARRDGANFDVSVVSDAQGKYAFPRSRIAPGAYTVKIRAIGYDLLGPAMVSVAAGTPATLDLKLQKTKDLSSQLTSVEWLMNVPGTDAQKSMVVKQILSCTYCHSLERIVKSSHDAAAFVPVITRMQKYFPDGTMAGTEGRGRVQFVEKSVQDNAEKNPNWSSFPKTELAAYLATINRSGGRTLPASPKTLPRPKGKETRVIITQYDMPRKDTVPHDMEVDAAGTPWYTDQSRPFLGKMDPKTGVFTEWKIPLPTTRHEFAGGSDLVQDKEGNIWFPATSDKVNTHFGWPVKFDPRTQTFTQIDMPAGAWTQFLSIGKDGKIWTGLSTHYRIDPKAMKMDYAVDWTKAPNAPPGPHMGYESAVDSKGNAYITDFAGHTIVRIDPKTNEITFYPTPTANSTPRRGRIDDQDRFWFGEYTGDRVAMFDTRTAKFQEWPTIPYSTPYTASVPDGKGHVYSPSNTADRVIRVDPKTGEVLYYLMPTRDFDTKQIAVDPVSKRGIWFANVRNARLVRVEPLD
jgi:virginiamycin B lyase